MPSESVNEFLSGGFGGLIGLIVGHPCDTMKTITQNSVTGATPGMRQLWSMMYQISPRTFFRGLSVPVMTYGGVNAVYFGTEKFARKFFGVQINASSPTDEHYYSLPLRQYGLIMLTGSIAGAAQLIPGVPTEVIKIRMQMDAHTAGTAPLVRTTVRNIYREMGLRGFYSGFSAYFLREVPASASYFFTYEATRRLLRRNTDLNDLLNSFIAGAFGGWVSWMLTLPQDVIKTRIQSGLDKDIPTCVRRLISEGRSSFFKGLGLVSIRALLVNGIIFVGDEVARQYLQQPDSDDQKSV